jgi:hypothetical protein
VPNSLNSSRDSTPRYASEVSPGRGRASGARAGCRAVANRPLNTHCAGGKCTSVPNCPILSIQAFQSGSQFPGHERETATSSPRRLFEPILHVSAQHIQYRVKPTNPSIMTGAILDLLRSRSELVLENAFLHLHKVACREKHPFRRSDA